VREEWNALEGNVMISTWHIVLFSNDDMGGMHTTLYAMTRSNLSMPLL
jgi:hypothetical protein